MPDVSIVIKATDHYSDAIKSMASSSQHFTKDMDGMQKKLDALNKTKSTLKVDTDKAKKDLVAAEKQFMTTGDAVAGLELQARRLTFEQARRNLSLVTKEASNLEKQMAQSGQAFSKAENQAASGSSGIGSVITAIAASGIGNMVGDLAQNFANSWVASAYGAETGTIFSSALSSAISGAALGTAIAPGIGTAIGAAAGGAVGLASGALQVQTQKDDSFKSYVQEAAQGQWDAQSTSLSTGSALAAQRETDRISFATLFGSEETAKSYLAELVDMSNNTPFLYDDLTAMSKTLATYGYGADSILPVLQTIGDTGAALGQSTSDMTAIAQALGRMRSSNKTTLEYLNILNDRGVGAVGMLADSFGVDQGTVYKMISEGKVAGQEAVEIILTALTDSFAGSMKKQSQTFSGLTSTVEGLEQELNNAMGEGYNTKRTQGLAEKRDFLNGSYGQSMQEAYRYMGQWQASLENTREKLERDALESVMTGGVMGSFGEGARKKLDQLHQEYEEALLAESQGDASAGAELGRIFSEAKVLAMNEYNASEGAQLALEAEKSLIQGIRDDTSLNKDYWDAGYEKGQEFTKGLAASISGGVNDIRPAAGAGNASWNARFGGVNIRMNDTAGKGSHRSYAVGLDYVPYDNFPALLHQGERVLTAQEARSEKNAPAGITIHIDTLAVREEADVDRVAQELLERLELAGRRG